MNEALNPQPSLNHIGVTAESMDDFCQVMEDAFRLKVATSDDNVSATVTLGHQKLVVTQASQDSGSRQRALDRVALGAPDPEALAQRISDAGLAVDRRTEGRRTTFLLSPEGWSGVPVEISNPASAIGAYDSDNNVLGIDHVGVASSDNGLVRQRFCDLLGLSVESVQTDTETTYRVEQFTSDKYGVRVQSSPAGPVTGLRVLFVTLDNFEFEFLQDLQAEVQADARRGPSGSTAGDQGAIANYVARQGPGLHHIALRVQDIDKALAQAESGGVRLIDRAGRPGSRRAQIAFMHPKSTGGVLFHFVQRDTTGTERLG